MQKGDHPVNCWRYTQQARDGIYLCIVRKLDDDGGSLFILCAEMLHASLKMTSDIGEKVVDPLLTRRQQAVQCALYLEHNRMSHKCDDLVWELCFAKVMFPNLLCP